MKQKILIRGPVLSQSGYGEQARFAMRALRTREDLFDIYVLPTGWGHSGWIIENNDERRWLDNHIRRTAEKLQGAQKNNIQPATLFDMSLQITIPNEWEKMAPINIGYTAGIETTKVSVPWLQKANEMDRIIVVSNHAKEVFEDSSYTASHPADPSQTVTLNCQTPIESVNYCSRKKDPISLDLNLEYDFNFLTMAVTSPRKNLGNTIRWFMEENFDREVGLVVKTSLKNNSVIDREFTETQLKQLLALYGDHKCRVYLLHGDMSDQELAGLYTHPKIKAILSTSHGEGFGLPLFEAACHAMPVVAPGWSGQCDFLYMPDSRRKATGKTRPMFASVEYDLKPIQPEAVWEGVLQADSNWCYPREASFKRRLRELHNKYPQFKKNAVKLQKWILKEFTADKQYEKFVKFTYGEKEFDHINVSVEMEDIPKISLITSVFDAEEHIEQLMKDITSQSIFEEKCEWILLNANPPGQDVEEEIILSYVKKYPNNIIYKRLKEDPGVYGVWNQAIEMSTGEFITNINCDDRRNLKGIEKQAKMLVSHADVDLVYNDSYIVHDPNITWDQIPSDADHYNFESFSREAMLRGNLPHNNPMWRKTLHDKNGFFDATYKSAGDWEFWLRCAFNNAIFIKYPEILGVYYFNPKGISTNPDNNDWKEKQEFEIFKKYQKLLLEERNT